MPVRTRTRLRDNGTGIEPEVFAHFDGTDSWFNQPHFETREQARQAWPAFRLAAWEMTHVGDVPRAAREYDGITAGGWELLWQTWAHQHFNPAPVLAALAEDRDHLDAFRRDQPKAAKPITGHLTLYREWLDHLAEIAGSRAEVAGWEFGQCPAPTSETYGDRLDRAAQDGTRATNGGRADA